MHTPFSSSYLRFLASISCALLLALSLAACDSNDDDDDDNGEGDAQTITDLAASRSDLSTTVAALQAAGLDDDLRTEGPFTVFAPNNDAFGGLDTEALLAAENAAILEKILGYHVIAAQEVEAADIEDGDTAETLEGSTLTFGVDGGTVTVNSATVTEADLDADNGVVHVIDGVLTENLNVVERAIAADGFDILVGAVVAAELDGALSGDGPFTVFAPTDEAFLAALDANEDGELGADELPENLAEILQYHVVAGEIAAADITDGLTAETLQGESLTFGVAEDGTVTINGDRTVVAPNIDVSNGIIHAIDGVLLPGGEGDDGGEED